MHPVRIKIIRTLRTCSPAALLGGAMLAGALVAGCGGTSERSLGTGSTTRSPTTIRSSTSARYAGVVKRNRVACERAVQTPPGLSASAKRELADLCFRINYIPEDNEKTVRSACEEAANASTLRSDSARRHAAADCYAQGFID